MKVSNPMAKKPTPAQTRYGAALCTLLALMLVAGVDLPRFYALGPGLVGVIFMALYKPVFKKPPIFSGEGFVIAGGILALAFLSTLWAIDPETSLDRGIKLIGVLIPGALLISLGHSLEPRKLLPSLKITALAAAVTALLVAGELLFDGPLYRLTRGLGGGEIPHAVFNRGTVAAVLCFFPCFALYKHFVPVKTAWLIFGLAFAAMLVAVESQSAQLAALIALLFYWFFPYRLKAAWYGLAALIAVFIFSAPYASQWAMSSLAPVLNTLPVIGQGGGFAGARIEIWDYVSRFALQNPLLGYGIEATRTITTFDSAQIYQQGTSILHPHNFALQLWMEFGLLGAALGAGFCGWLLWRMQKTLSPKQARVALPTFMAALSVSATGYGLWQSWWLGLLFMAAFLCMLAIRLLDEEKNA